MLQCVKFYLLISYSFYLQIICYSSKRNVFSFLPFLVFPMETYLLTRLTVFSACFLVWGGLTWGPFSLDGLTSSTCLVLRSISISDLLRISEHLLVQFLVTYSVLNFCPALTLPCICNAMQQPKLKARGETWYYNIGDSYGVWESFSPCLRNTISLSHHSWISFI